MASTSSSTSLSTHSFKRDVFLSFMGEDTRHGFISHLHSALSRNSIRTFIDDELERGEEISQSLLNAIEESMSAVVVFSKGYAFSRWCLDELAKIMECIDSRGLKVIPVFYHVDPSDVRNQTGTFAEAFVGHEAKFNSDTEKLQRWRAALTKAANQSGWDTENCRSESDMVDEIVNCIWEDLQKMLPSPLKGLVAIVPRIEQLQSLLFGHGSSSSVLILGLWGMGGIGKTTIAKALYGQIKSLFERHYFLADVRGEAEKQRLEILRERLLNGVSGEKIGMPDIDQFFYMFRGKKVLVVLDDVDDRKQLKSLIGDLDCYGPGSRFIVTSRDQQLLKNYVLYEVKPLLSPDALQLFSLHAFKDNGPTDDLRKLSTLVVDYAKGVPLALEVLGSFLFKRGKGEWESTLEKLKNAPHKEIQDVLRISYSSLDKKEKEIFLWIACFLRGVKKDHVIEFLDGCGFSTEIGLSVLVGKSLITIKWDVIGMHDLLQEMGREIVREESEDPGERRFLWNQEDIYQVFKRNSGTKRIKGIGLNTSGMREVQLLPDTFARMSNLKFLHIWERDEEDDEEDDEEHMTRLENCKVRLPEGISALPDELRYLIWEGYPSESLPANFNPENLIGLRLYESKITELFCDEMPDMVKLIKINLQDSKQLCKISNLSRARNVRMLILSGCDSLCEVSSICHLGQVTLIDLSRCPKLRSLPDLRDLKCLERLLLDSCSNLETFPKVPRSIKTLNLSGTAIKEVPSASMKYLDNLVWLIMINCSQLESLSSNVDLKSLQYLELSGCSLLKKFPEVSKNLEFLFLNETAITEVPSSVECLSKLKTLSLRGCTELRILPSTIRELHSLSTLYLVGCSNLTELPQPTDLLTSLNLSGCNFLPTDLGRLSSLEWLYLGGNSCKTIPSIKQLSLLKELDITDCKSLQSLPELPPRLIDIQASGCTSLQTISAVFELPISPWHLGTFNFADCIKVDGKEFVEMVGDLTNRMPDEEWLVWNGGSHGVSIAYMGSGLPKCFKHPSVGDSVSLPFSSNLLNDGFVGFALGFVSKSCGSAGCNLSRFWCDCYFGDDKKTRFSCLQHSGFGIKREVAVMTFDYSTHRRILDKSEFRYDDVLLFKFGHDGKGEDCCKIKICGVIPLYARVDYETLQPLPLGGAAGGPAEAALDEVELGCNALQLLPFGGPAEAAIDEVELGQNHSSRELDVEPPPKRLKQISA